MTLTTILRGFKVPLRVLDAFLIANGIDYETERLCAGMPPMYNDSQDPDAVTQLLRSKAGDADKTNLFLPYKMSFDFSSHAYIAYDWIMIFAQRRIKADELPETPPPGFENLRKEMLSHASPDHPLVDDDAYQNALYIVSTDERTYVPQELRRRQTDIKCDQCEATFENGCWLDRQAHRQDVHGSSEGMNELPEDA